MSLYLLDKQEVQDICEHTTLRARKWSRFICKRASEDTVLHYRARSAEERRYFTSRGAYIKLRYIADVIHSFDWKSAIEHDGDVKNA